jgi:hypothetical protein
LHPPHEPVQQQRLHQLRLLFASKSGPKLQMQHQQFARVSLVNACATTTSTRIQLHSPLLPHTSVLQLGCKLMKAWQQVMMAVGVFASAVLMAPLLSVACRCLTQRKAAL